MAHGKSEWKKVAGWTFCVFTVANAGDPDDPHPCSFLPLNPDDVSAIIEYKDGRHQKRETGYGNSFLSQSGRFITVDNTISSIEITNSKGKTRRQYF